MAEHDPQIRRDPTERRSLEPHTLEQLSKMKLSLQIIVFSLVMGVVLFLGIVLRNLNKPWTLLGPDHQWHMLILAGIAIPPALIVPGIIRRSRRPVGDPAATQVMTGEPLHDAAIAAAIRLQLATIVGCALLEGPAFANTVALMISGDRIHLIVTGVLVLGVVCWFPTTPSGEH